MTAPALSVRELSLALAHRWEPQRLFMFVFTAYLDESGTHDGSPVTVMGGLLARAEQWENFEKGFGKLQKQHGFRVWHSKKFKRRDGDFKGWSVEQCTALYWDLAFLTSRGLTGAVTMTLNNADFDKYYKSGPKPRKAVLDTKYGYCFRMCLYHFVAEVFKRRHRKKIAPLHVVLEAGHRNYGDAERVFLEVKKDFEARGNYMLRTITKADKDSCGQLMMADFAAHGEYVLETRAAAGQPRNRVPVSEPIPKGATVHVAAYSKPELLAKMRAEIIEKAIPKKGPNARSSEMATVDPEQSS